MATAAPIARAPAPAMTLVEHLSELRRRLAVALVWVSLGAMIGFWQHEALFAWLLAPVKHLPLMVTSPTEGFRATVTVSLYAGLALAWPGVLAQLVGFVTPGLTPRERRALVPALMLASGLFAFGVWLAYATLLPAGIHFLVGFAPTEVSAMLSLEAYMGFAAGVVVAGGVMCQLPVALGLAAWLDLVTSAQLRQWRRYAIFGAFALAAVASPAPDPLSQALMVGVLMSLYEASAAAIRWAGK
ncbi:MAG: twin-arginine translocase subunit TatC [Candidatus Sericytochromatia bacterium]